MTKSGFVSIVGRPNVGKSTLLNAIIGEKISIISDKPQTTRNNLVLIHSEERGQIVFVDTPGVQTPRNALGEYMEKLSMSALEDMDLVIYLVDESDYIGRMDRQIIGQLKNLRTPVLAVVNKLDLVQGDKLEEIKKMYAAELENREITAISAYKKVGIESLLDKIFSLLPEGPLYYPEDQITDSSERFIASEIIREKALLNLDDEIPHGINVTVESMKEREGKSIIDIEATIYCEKESHKGMVIGKGGKMLKTIGSQSRPELEILTGMRVNLKLWVKVEKNWRDKESKLRKFGYK